jgi:putative membrane protein
MNDLDPRFWDNGFRGLLAANDLDPHFWENLFRGVVLSLVYGAVGIFLTALGFKVFDWMTPKIDIEKQLADRQNVAVAIICAAIIVGVSYVIATAIR